MPVPIWAGRYIGLPFAAHGRSRSGLDCWGLVRLAAKEQRISSMGEGITRIEHYLRQKH